MLINCHKDLTVLRANAFVCKILNQSIEFSLSFAMTNMGKSQFYILQITYTKSKKFMGHSCNKQSYKMTRVFYPKNVM